MKKRNTSRALVARPAQKALLGPSFELYPAALTVIGKPTKEEYTEAFRRLELIEGAIHWWYGDLCLAYEGHYRAITDIAEQSGFDVGTIYNDKWVASRYEVSYRYETLTFKHHLIAAPLDNRLEWLKKAEENTWSTRTLELEINKEKRCQLALPEGIYDVIYADPPWQYSNVLWPGAAEDHYPTMSIEELCNMKIPAADNAVLFLWVTNPFLRDAFQVIDAWQFEYKTNIVWIKAALKKPGTGFWVRGRHELLFICGRGSFVPNQAGQEPIGSVISADVGEHSKKPDIVYEMIEKMYPNQRYLELFARNSHKGWTSWGNELQLPSEIPGRERSLQ